MIKKLIIDTNLLLLLVVGIIDEGNYIKRSTRLKDFNEDDFQRITTIIGFFNEVYITPYIATEVSNLIDLDGDVRDEIFIKFRLLVEELIKVINVDLINDMDGQTFLRYGLTDNSLISLVSNYFVLTNDSRLCSVLYDIKAENVLQYSVLKNLSEIAIKDLIF